jgi:hypothetical protein
MKPYKVAPACVSLNETKPGSSAHRVLSVLVVAALLGVPIVVLGTNMMTSGSFSAAVAQSEAAEGLALMIVPREPPAAVAIAAENGAPASADVPIDSTALTGDALSVAALQVADTRTPGAISEIVPVDDASLGVSRRGRIAPMVAREFSDGRSFWRIGKGSKVVRSAIIKSLADAAMWSRRTRATPVLTTRPVGRQGYLANRG